jgi:hypothetical protein
MNRLKKSLTESQKYRNIQLECIRHPLQEEESCNQNYMAVNDYCNNINHTHLTASTKLFPFSFPLPFISDWTAASALSFER